MQDFFDAVHLQRAHPFIQGAGKDFRNPGFFLDQFFHRIAADQQFVQANPPLVAGVIAGRAALGAVEREFAILGIAPQPLLPDGFQRARRFLFPGVGIGQLVAEFME